MMPQLSIRSQFLFFCFIAAVQAYTVFETTCSAPTVVTNFVSSPNTRGTLDILWSSLFTILACTWTLQHPNIPEQRNGRDPGWIGDLKWQLRGFYQSAKLMLWTVLAPEVIIAAACVDLLCAKWANKRLQFYALKDGITWTLTQSYYANMGGFVIQRNRKENAACHDPFHLTANDIYRLREGNILQKLPEITDEELNDKSKADSPVKVIAVFQILWTALQILARAVKKLSISPLEFAVLAFAVCAIIIYALYWEKPKSIRTTITVIQYPGQIPPDVLNILKSYNTNTDLIGYFLSPSLRSTRLPGAPLSIDNISGIEVDMLSPFIGLFTGMLGAVVFSGIHIGAWNFDFPSMTDLILWRCASVYSAAFGLLFILHFVLLMILEGSFEEPRENFYDHVYGRPGAYLLSSLYVIARLVILVEIFRTLFFLPPDSYISTWSSNIPPIS